MLDYGLSKQQIDVINALSSGVNMTTAAEQAGIHRNTITNWRRNLLPFQKAYADAQYDRALYLREKIEERIDRALQTIDEILADPKAPASVRLKAALAIIQTASTPPDPKKQVELDIEKIVVERTPVETVTEDQFAPAPPEPQAAPVHNHAQPASAPASEPLANSPEMHKDAQPPSRQNPKISRNHVCPCGSGKKYKRCCLNTQALATAA